MTVEAIYVLRLKIIGTLTKQKFSDSHVAKVRQSYYLDCKTLLLRGDLKWAILK